MEDGVSIRVPQWTIARDVAKRILFNRRFQKTARFSSSKRVFLPNDPEMKTVPFGWSAKL